MTKVEAFRQWILTRDEELFGRFYDWLCDKVRCYIYKNGWVYNADMEDVIQDVVARLCLVPPGTEVKSPLGFLNSVVRHVVLYYQRDVEMRTPTPMSSLNPEDVPAEGMYFWDGSELLDRQHVKDKLRPVAPLISRMTYRCLRLRTLGYGWMEIGNRCRIHHKAARRQVARANRHLAEIAA